MSAEHHLEFYEYETRLAAYAVIIDERGMLLSWFNHPKRAGWSLPGGGVDFEETVEQGLVREIYEETGYHAEITGLLTVTSSTWPTGDRGRPFKAVRVIFSARVVGGELGTIEVGGSTDHADWLAVAEVEAAVPATSTVRAGLDAWRAAR